MLKGQSCQREALLTCCRGATGWDDYFMSIAILSSMRSKDPSTQVGACIVNQDKKIVGIGCPFARSLL